MQYYNNNQIGQGGVQQQSLQASQPHHAIKNQKQGPQARILDTSSSTESKQRMTVSQMKASGGHMQGANQQVIG